jgi:hypothetical protein
LIYHFFRDWIYFRSLEMYRVFEYMYNYEWSSRNDDSAEEKTKNILNCHNIHTPLHLPQINTSFKTNPQLNDNFPKIIGH